MKQLKPIALAGSIALLVLGSTASYAGDCLNVKQKFHNEGSTVIEVTRTQIEGNQGTWVDNFTNISVYSGQHGSTNRHRMDYLDSGRKPEFIKVFFKRWDPNNLVWRNKSKVLTDLRRCHDGMTYDLHINQNG